MRLEVKIGIFVFLGLLSLFILSMQVNSFSNYGKKGYTLYALINDATGLRLNAKVKMRGVNIGFVRNKELEKEQVKLTLFIEKGIQIPINSVITLSQDSMLGEKYVKVIPVRSDKYIQADNSFTKYLKVATFDEAVNSINAAAEEFKKFMVSLNTAVDKESIANFKQTLVNLKDGTNYFKNILAENREGFKKAVKQTNQMLYTINQKLPAIMSQIDSLSYRFDKTGQIINQKLPKILAQTDELTNEFKLTGKNINQKLPTLLNKFETIEDNLNTILVENKKPLNRAISSADTFFTSGGNAFTKLDDYFTSLQQSELDVEIANYYMINDGYNQIRAELDYRPKPDKYYILGVTSTNDYTDETKFNAKHQKTKTYITAELGKRYNDVLFRGGLIDSTGGLGVDYFMYNDKVRFRGEIYDFNAVNDIRGDKPHLRLETKYNTLKHLNFYAGIDNLLNKNSASFYLGLGIGFKDDDLKTLLGSSGSSLLK